MPAITYVDDHHLVVANTHFHCEFPFRSAPDGRLVIIKTVDMVRRYERLIEELQPVRIVELGIRRGGSTALLYELALPEKLVAVDIVDAAPDLDEFTASGGVGHVVRPYYGIDQADTARMRSILDDEFGGEPLDLVVDDASHLYEETVTSFELLFPRLRPGGRFVIEDWSADQRQNDQAARALQTPTEDQLAGLAKLMAAHEGGKIEVPAPLLRLGIELLLWRARSGEAVESVEIDRHWISITRGAGRLPDDFRLEDQYMDYWGFLS